MTFDSSLTDPPIALSYDQALAFWFGLINYEQRVPLPADLKLERMRALLECLGQPQRRLRIVHVAGSKGKGSTSAMLAAMLQAAGYRTGLFTSPHLCAVEERIQVNGQPISREELAALLRVIQAVTLRTGLTPTFFEVATALGFLHFVRRRVEAAVLEVGLGGRFDSTNVCTPEVALITSISLDHTRQLGDRLASIAMEKAGIVKPGRSAISGATAPEAREVIEQICRQRRVTLEQLGRDFDYEYEPAHIGAAAAPGSARGSQVSIRTRSRHWPRMELSLLGEHQAANAAVAIATVEQLRRRGWHLPDQAVAAGLANVYWPARLEIMGQRPLVVLDCAHNVASAQALVDTLQSSFPPCRRWLVFASSNDKDVAGIFRILAPHFDQAFLTRYGDNPRSVPPEELALLLQRHSKLRATIHERAAEALKAARQQARKDDLICITGSVFLAGELRPLLLKGILEENHALHVY
jgi:dihydrofolate synthase/folylpolyglutamate synthase